MDFGGNGGFQGYRRFPEPNSGMEVPEISMELPAQLNQTINNNSSGDDNESPVGEQNHFMPMAKVTRIMRKILPPHAKISNDTKETMQECVSEFVSFITGEANDRCLKEQRKTITPEDILWAMGNLGFDDYIEPLTRYLHRYREYADGERGSLRGEPSMERTTDPVNYGTATFAPSFVPHHPGFFGPTPVPITGFLNDPSGAGPSRVAVPNLEPFAQPAPMTGLLNYPSSAGPSQVANLEPFAQPAAPMTRLLNYPSFAGPSQVANLEPLAQPAPITRLLRDPSGAGPTQPPGG